MPTDVEVGSGYCGDALFNRFPGQYRDPEMNTQEKAHFASFPGNHGPVYTDPDVGRKMVLKDVPGIGQVVVPVEHTMAACPQPRPAMGAVYPSDHTMVGFGDDPSTDHGKLHWHNTLVNALDQTAHYTSAPAQLGASFNAVAQAAVKRAIIKAKAGQFRSVEAAVKYVRDAITAAAGNFKPQVQKIAIQIADTASKAAQPLLKGVFKAPSAVRTPKGVSDWPGSMMGQLTASIINLTAGSDLDSLAASISKLLDATTNAFNQLMSLQQQEAAAQAIAPAVGSPAPDDQLYIQYQQAITAINQGYSALTGFDYLATILLKVFTPNAAALRNVYGGLDGLILQLQNWDSTWQTQVANTHPDQSALWDQIQNLHNQLYGIATGGKALNIDDPAYLQTAGQAVQQLTNVSPDQAGMSGMGDFGISALIAVIIICIAAVAVSIAVVKLASQFNVVANQISAQRQQYNTTSASQHDAFVANEIAQGTDPAQAERDWLPIKAQMDAQEAQAEAEYGKNTPSALDITKYIPFVVGGAVVIVALPHIMKAVGL